MAKSVAAIVATRYLSRAFQMGAVLLCAVALSSDEYEVFAIYMNTFLLLAAPLAYASQATILAHGIRESKLPRAVAISILALAVASAIVFAGYQQFALGLGSNKIWTTIVFALSVIAYAASYAYGGVLLSNQKTILFALSDVSLRFSFLLLVGFLYIVDKMEARLVIFVYLACCIISLLIGLYGARQFSPSNAPSIDYPKTFYMLYLQSAISYLNIRYPILILPLFGFASEAASFFFFAQLTDVFVEAFGSGGLAILKKYAPGSSQDNLERDRLLVIVAVVATACAPLHFCLCYAVTTYLKPDLMLWPVLTTFSLALPFVLTSKVVSPILAASKQRGTTIAVAVFALVIPNGLATLAVLPVGYPAALVGYLAGACIYALGTTSILAAKKA